MVAAVLAWSPFATAQEDERARLHASAQAAYQRGQHAEALDFALRAGSLGMTPQLRLFIAVQHEALGHLVEAVESAERCVRETEAASSSPALDTVLERCRAMVQGLGSRVGRVVVRPPTPAPEGMLVRLQGAELDASRWGAAVPVLPGRVVVEAVFRGGLSLRREITVAAGAREEVRLEAPRAPQPQPATPIPPVITPTPPPPSPLVAPWIVAGGGVALMAVSGVMIALRDARVEERDALCPNATCATTAARQQAGGLDDEARTLQTVGYVSLGVGTAALVGGVVWWIAARPRSSRAAVAWQPSLRVSATGAVSGVTVTF